MLRNINRIHFRILSSWSLAPMGGGGGLQSHRIALSCNKYVNKQKARVAYFIDIQYEHGKLSVFRYAPYARYNK